MTGTIDREWTPADAARFGAVWGRLGWIGFFLQIALLAVPIFLTIYILSFALGGANFGIGRFLTYASLVLMAFTTFWFYRYTVLAGRLRDGDGSVDVPQIFSTLWIGL